MAKITFAKILPKFDNFAQFDGSTLKLTALAGDTFTLEDKDGTSMVFSGSGFERTDSVVTGGTIKSAEFFNSDGERIYTFENVSADAEELYKTFTLNHDPMRIIHGLTEGNDTISGNKRADNIWGFGGDDTLNGKGGADWLYGHRGNDTLTGGTGADTFVFQTGYDSDTVTDFDLTGSDHDFIRIDYYLFNDLVYTELNGSVTLEMPTGDTLTLLNVTKAEIEGQTKYFDFF